MNKNIGLSVQLAIFFRRTSFDYLIHYFVHILTLSDKNINKNTTKLSNKTYNHFAQQQIKMAFNLFSEFILHKWKENGKQIHRATFQVTAHQVLTHPSMFIDFMILMGLKNHDKKVECHFNAIEN